MGPKFDTSTNKWNYEMWRVKHDYGRVLFGVQKANTGSTFVGLDEILNNDDWAICHGWDDARQKAVVIPRETDRARI